MKRKAKGEKKSPFLRGVVNREAFVCPCPPAPAGLREQGELIRQIGSCWEAGGSRMRGRDGDACETPSLLLTEPSSSSSFLLAPIHLPLCWTSAGDCVPVGLSGGVGDTSVG